ncbi:hypothetical protein SAMN04488595_10845 [Ralstonia sp. 25mfcol4.1]|nr:hypothetical protein SAMN04488595_10845 [Ralstonia sp. 25mfcol4.1]
MWWLVIRSIWSNEAAFELVRRIHARSLYRQYKAARSRS